MISFDAIATAIAQERQASERRNRRWMAMARRQDAGSIRQRIGQRFIRMGERLIAAPAG